MALTWNANWKDVLLSLCVHRDPVLCWKHLVHTTSPSIPYLLGATTTLGHTDSYFYHPHHPLTQHYIPPQKSSGTGLKKRNVQVCSKFILPVTTETWHAVSHPLSRNVLELLLNLNAIIWKQEGEKINFHSFTFKINFPSFPSDIPQVKSQRTSWPATAYSYQGVHAASPNLPLCTREIRLLQICRISSS